MKVKDLQESEIPNSPPPPPPIPEGLTRSETTRDFIEEFRSVNDSNESDDTNASDSASGKFMHCSH